MRYAVGDKVRVVYSVIDPPWMKDDNRCTIIRADHDFRNRAGYRIRHEVTGREYGLYAASELVAGWTDADPIDPVLRDYLVGMGLIAWLARPAWVNDLSDDMQRAWLGNAIRAIAGDLLEEWS